MTMLAKWIIGSLLLFLIIWIWILIQRAAATLARRHPECATTRAAACTGGCMSACRTPPAMPEDPKETP